MQTIREEIGVQECQLGFFTCDLAQKMKTSATIRKSSSASELGSFSHFALGKRCNSQPVNTSYPTTLLNRPTGQRLVNYIPRVCIISIDGIPLLTVSSD